MKKACDKKKKKKKKKKKGNLSYEVREAGYIEYVNNTECLTS